MRISLQRSVLFFAAAYICGSRVENTGEKSVCGSVIDLLDCHPLEPVPFFRTKANTIRSWYEPGDKCVIKNVYFDWLLLFESEIVFNLSNYDRTDFVIEPYALRSGNYQIVLNVAEYDWNGFKNVLSDQCEFTMISEQPLPIIRGTEEITMNIGKTIPVVHNVPPNRNGSLSYEWRSDVMEKHGSDIANRRLRNDTVSRITRDAKKNTVEFVCRENCKPGVIDVTKKIVIGLICSDCHDLDFEIFLDLSGYHNGSKMVLDRNEILIDPNTLQNGKNYVLTISDDFLLGDGYIWYIEKSEFMLGANDRVRVKAFDEYGTSISVELNVKVESTFKDVNTKEKLENEVQKQYFEKNSKKIYHDFVGEVGKCQMKGIGRYNQ
ncbi:hypothetical protein JTB14_014084 [Gonioctena quinquepunctata]|nr:hypothetical protein JTB14_014084 [Gonioctena quinquepunctata]